MRRYDPYRGRGRLRAFLKVLIVILVIALAVAVATFFLLDRHLVISADGYRLELPFFRQEETPAPSPEDTGGDLPLVVETPGATRPVVAPAAEAIRGVLLPRTALYDGTAEELVAAVGGSAAIFDMKADDGSLGYISQQPLAVTAKVSADNPAINAAIRGLNAGELYTVARVSCFRDNAAPYYDNTTALRSSAGNWRDSEGIRWLSVGRQSARDYVAGVCAELAELGFDEILLDCAAYPVDGGTDRIVRGDAYDPDDLTGPVAEFYAQVARALEDYPQVRLSIVAGEALLTGEDDGSGQTPELLRQYARRVWVTLPESGLTRPSGDLAAAQVVWMAAQEPSGAENWAIWPENE